MTPADQPGNPLHVLTVPELTAYRRALEGAIAFFGLQDPVPPVRADLQDQLDQVIAEQDHRARPADA